MGKHSDIKSQDSTDENRHKTKGKMRKSGSSSEDEWVEKTVDNPSKFNDQGTHEANSAVSKGETKSNKRKDRKHRHRSHSIESDRSRTEKIRSPAESSKLPHNSVAESNTSKRDEWMNLPTTFVTSSNSDRRRDREQKKAQEKQPQYDPKESVRELNPYWRDGGDGLPKFKKPTFTQEDLNNIRDDSYARKYSSHGRSSGWKKPKTSEERSHDSKNSSKVREDYSDSSRKSRNTENHSHDNKNRSKIMESDSNQDSRVENEVVTEKELNILGAKIVKAEIMGDTKLVNELKEKLEKAKDLVKADKDTKKNEEVLLTHTDSQGRSQPLQLQSEPGESSKHKRKRVQTHQDGERTKYFADDDKHSLKQMFENEKYNTAEDQDGEFLKMVHNVEKDDFDDIFTDNIRKEQSSSKIDSRNRDRAIQDHQQMSKCLDTCKKCVQSEQMSKHLMVTMKETVYLVLPPHEPLREGHCLIVPIRHVSCSTQLDENEWEEIMNMRKRLVQLFKRRVEGVVFFEIATALHTYPHMAIECIPIPRETEHMAPIYFKKAIDECETEWTQNKKLVSLKGRDVRRAIPKGLPYFSVSFGMEEGYAHVIEDQKLFPSNFAQEIIGGMLDLPHSKWRKPKRQTFEEQTKRVSVFSREWSSLD